MTVAILGGTFDPIHYGHTRMALALKEELELDQLILLPAGRTPHRNVQASGEHRWAMLQLALADMGDAAVGLQLDDRELKDPDFSYTVVTLGRWRRSISPMEPLIFIVGSDAFYGLS